MNADGLLADEEALPDLAVRPTLGDKGEDLVLAPRQAKRVAAWRRRRPHDAAEQIRRAGAVRRPCHGRSRGWLCMRPGHPVFGEERWRLFAVIADRRRRVGDERLSEARRVAGAGSLERPSRHQSISLALSQ